MPKKEITTYDEPRKAYHKCPACSKYIHVRHRECACGNVISTKSNKKILDVALIIPINPKLPAPYDNMNIEGVIVEPKGECPIEIADPFGADEIHKWVTDLRSSIAKNENLFLTNRAIRHWAGIKFAPDSRQYQDICGFLVSEVQDVQFGGRA